MGQFLDSGLRDRDDDKTEIAVHQLGSTFAEEA